MISNIMKGVQMVLTIQSDTVYPSMMIQDVFTRIKHKALTITSKAFLITSTKMFTIVRDELLNISNELESIIDTATIEEIEESDIVTSFKRFDKDKDKLMVIYDQLENCKEPYEIVLLDVVDETLDHLTKIINMLMYLNSKLTRHNFKVA